MPRAAVWDALRYVEQLDQLPPEVGSVLTISHHRELYRVRDKQLKIRLARSAVRRGLKVRELRDHVRTALGPDERGRGRPKKTRFQKLVGDLEKATAAVAAEPLTSEDLAGLSPRQVTKLRRELQRQVLVLSRALAQVEELARR